MLVNELECLSLSGLSIPLMVEGKAGAYPSVAPLGAPFKGRLLALATKQLSRFESPSKDKHSSLLRYGRKKSYNIGASGQC
jgi:hypothetical protein